MSTSFPTRSGVLVSFGLVFTLILSGCGTGLSNIAGNRSVDDMKAEQYLHDLNWLSYTNKVRGVKFNYPKQVLNTQNFFCPPIPTVVIENGDWVYVAPEKIYAEGKTCNDTTPVTKENIQKFALLGIVSGDASDKTGVETFLQKTYAAPDCKVNAMNIFRDGPQQLVVRGKGCQNIPDDVMILFQPDLKKVMAYPQKPTKVKVFQTIDPQKQGFVQKNADTEVWGSIGFAG